MIYLLLALVIVSAVSFFWIRKLIKDKKSLAFKLEYADSRIDFYQKNRQAYQAVMDKLTEGKKDADKLKEKVNNSNGSDLADILNGL